MPNAQSLSKLGLYACLSLGLLVVPAMSAFYKPTAIVKEIHAYPHLDTSGSPAEDSDFDFTADYGMTIVVLPGRSPILYYYSQRAPISFLSLAHIIE